MGHPSVRPSVRLSKVEDPAIPGLRIETWATRLRIEGHPSSVKHTNAT